jgi:hypothetical protein
MTSPIEKSSCIIEYAKTNSCTSVQQAFAHIHIREHRYSGAVTTLRTRDEFVRRQTVAVLVGVMRLYGTWRPLSIEVQRNLCGREGGSYRYRKRLCGPLCADGCAWNLTVPRCKTLGFWELELQMKWPPRSPDLTPCDTFLWGYVKEQAFVPALPLDIDAPKLRITAAPRQLTGTCYREHGMTWSGGWAFVGPTVSIFRIR